MRLVQEDPDFISEHGETLVLEKFPHLRIDIPKGAVIRTTQMSMQILPVPDEAREKLAKNVYCSPIVTLCPTRRLLRRFFKLTIPFPGGQLDTATQEIKCYIRLSTVDDMSVNWEDIGGDVRMTSNNHTKVAHISSKICGSYWIFISPKENPLKLQEVNYVFDSISLEMDDVKPNKEIKNQINQAVSTIDGNRTSSQFFRAVRSGDLSRIKQMLISGTASLDIQEENTGWTAFHIACIQGRTPVVSEFINHGASLNDRTKKGNTPLHLATIFGHSDVVKLLLDNGATSDLYSKAGFTPLHISVINGSDEILTDILQYDHSTKLNTETGQTAMDLAFQYNRRTTISILLVHLSNRSKRKNTEALKELIKVIDNLEKNKTLDNQFADAFHLAENTVTRCIHEEIQSEIDSIQSITDTRIKAYLVAAYTGNLQGVKDFTHLRNVQDLVTNQGNMMTGLHCACLGGHEDIVNYLLKCHHPIDCQTLTGYTPLFLAGRANCNSIVELLITEGADTSIKNKLGCSPCLYAKAERNQELASTLSKSRRLHQYNSEQLKRRNILCVIC